MTLSGGTTGLSVIMRDSSFRGLSSFSCRDSRVFMMSAVEVRYQIQGV